ncbi:amino acid permease 6-like [Wolffia australiana]
MTQSPEVISGQEEDDHERQGTVWTGTAHVLSAVIGSGILALAWSVAQLGWFLGPVVLLGFAMVTFYTSTLLADCYRFPTPDSSHRNITYMDAVRSYLGPREVFFCGLAQFANLWGTMVGYTITATTSMMAVKRSNCFHQNGHSAACAVSGNKFMVLFGLMEIALSQFPSLEKITWVSTAAAAMSFAYSLIGLGLSAVRLASDGRILGSLGGASAASSAAKAWNALQALGNIAFAYTFAEVLIEIQDTLKSPPAENKTMKKVTKYGIGLTAAFYLSLGCVGYAAFGNSAPGNILTGFGFYEPFWLVDVANLCIVIHLAGAYQVFAQPIFAAVEKSLTARWPGAKSSSANYTPRLALRVALRTALVALTTAVAALIPFFNSVLGLLGATSFWPLSVYFPVAMHIAQAKVPPWKKKWLFLHAFSLVCLLVSLLATFGSVADIFSSLKHSTPFHVNY